MCINFIHKAQSDMIIAYELLLQTKVLLISIFIIKYSSNRTISYKIDLVQGEFVPPIINYYLSVVNTVSN